MTTYSLHVAAILSSAIVAIGYAGPVAADPRSAPEHTLLAQAASEDTMARCQQLFGLWSRHNTDGYAKPLDARMAMEDCQKGNYASGAAQASRREAARSGVEDWAPSVRLTPAGRMALQYITSPPFGDRVAPT